MAKQVRTTEISQLTVTKVWCMLTATAAKLDRKSCLHLPIQEGRGQVCVDRYTIYILVYNHQKLMNTNAYIFVATVSGGRKITKNTQAQPFIMLIAV